MNYYIQCEAFAFVSRGSNNNILHIVYANRYMVDPRQRIFLVNPQKVTVWLIKFTRKKYLLTLSSCSHQIGVRQSRTAIFKYPCSVSGGNV